MKNALKPFHLIAAGLMLVGMLLAAFAAMQILVPIYGPRIEAYISPVIVPSDRLTIRREGRAVVVRLWATKVRGECKYVPDSATFLAGSDDSGWRRQWYERPGARPGPSRPEGEQDFEDWWFPDVAPRELIRGSWTYRCHDWWQTPADLGPWVAP